MHCGVALAYLGDEPRYLLPICVIGCEQQSQHRPLNSIV